MRKIVMTLLLFASAASASAQQASLLVYRVWEEGIDPYISRILVTPDYLRLDEGEGSDGFTLFDRQQEIIYSVSLEERSVLVIDHTDMVPGDNDGLILDEEVVEEAVTEAQFEGMVNVDYSGWVQDAAPPVSPQLDTLFCGVTREGLVEIHSKDAPGKVALGVLEAGEVAERKVDAAAVGEVFADVADDVRLAGGDVSISGTIGDDAIAAGGSSLRDFRQADGELGYFQHTFDVYDREGAPCRRPECTGTIRRVVQSGRSMMMLLNDILDLAKIEAGHVTIEREPTDLGELIRECTRLHHASAQKKGLELTCEGPARGPYIITDGLRVRQILLNLLTNAVKFSPEGGRILFTGRSTDSDFPRRRRSEA